MLKDENGKVGQASNEIKQEEEQQEQSTPQGLALLALLAFVASFVTARVFATLNPKTVAEAGGIHFHHFWYGVTMVVVVGWLAIAYSLPSLKRIYAIVFGLGAGLMGDEIGLFLTMGNYNSSITFFFFVIVVSIASTVIFARDRTKIEYDVTGLKYHEWALLGGAVVMGLSSVPFADGLLGVGVLIVGAGALVTLVGIVWGRR